MMIDDDDDDDGDERAGRTHLERPCAAGPTTRVTPRSAQPAHPAARVVILGNGIGVAGHGRGVIAVVVGTDWLRERLALPAAVLAIVAMNGHVLQAALRHHQE